MLVKNHLDELLKLVNESKQADIRFKDWNRIIKWEVEGENYFWATNKDGIVNSNYGKADIVLKCNANTVKRLANKDLPFFIAIWATGDVKFEGSFSDAFRMGYIFLNDNRKKKVVFLSHCFLNTNTRFPGGCAYEGATTPLIKLLLESGVGIIQMPCPEYQCLGLEKYKYGELVHDELRSCFRELALDVVEQVEDEIGAVNMAQGAWYAGARALITTSGGGFALMNEGLSLAGVTETPLVFHIGQRPGPGTGLPTRMGQEDLLFTLFGGHGEFPRIILAPGDLKDGYLLGKKAFDLADKYQVPVFILTDQYYLDSNYNIDGLPFSDEQPEHYIVETEENYKRYKFTEDGISPRGVPGHGKGVVAVDSDEHDQEGHITENFDTRIKMVDKRLKKIDKILDDYVDPDLIGAKDYDILLVSWGSTKNAVAAALEEIDNDKIGYLHIKQMAPLHSKIEDYLARANKSICIENNATGQLAKIIKMETEQSIDSTILKYNGLPFSREELIEKIKSEIREV